LPVAAPCAGVPHGIPEHEAGGGTDGSASPGVVAQVAAVVADDGAGDTSEQGAIHGLGTKDLRRQWGEGEEAKTEGERGFHGWDKMV
jgi:hypothetical protein